MRFKILIEHPFIPGGYYPRELFLGQAVSAVKPPPGYARAFYQQVQQWSEMIAEMADMGDTTATAGVLTEGGDISLDDALSRPHPCLTDQHYLAELASPPALVWLALSTN